MINVFKKFSSPALCLFKVVNVAFFVWIQDNGSIFNVRSHNCFLKKCKAGIIQSTKYFD